MMIAEKKRKDGKDFMNRRGLVWRQRRRKKADKPERTQKKVGAPHR